MINSEADFSSRPSYDPNSVAGKVVKAYSRASGTLMWGMYGQATWALVTSDERAVSVGLAALRSGATAQRVADGLAEYVRLQANRKMLYRAELALQGITIQQKEIHNG